MKYWPGPWSVGRTAEICRGPVSFVSAATPGTVATIACSVGGDGGTYTGVVGELGSLEHAASIKLSRMAGRGAIIIIPTARARPSLTPRPAPRAFGRQFGVRPLLSLCTMRLGASASSTG